MQDELDRIRRRDFLRMGGASVAAAGLSTLLPAEQAQTQPQEPGGTRNTPARPIVLRSEQLEVTLDADDALPYEYHWRATGARLRGEDYGMKITVNACQRSAWRFFQATLEKPQVKATEAHGAHNAVFHLVARDGQQQCFSADLRYELRGTSLFITLENVYEDNGYELIDIAMPHLATVREQDGSAWLVYGDSGGSFVALSEAKPGTLPPNSFWGRIHGGMPITMVGTDRMLCMQETTAFMDTTEVAVTGSTGSRRATIGSCRVHRVDGHDCYNMNLGSGAPLNCGTASTPNLRVDDTPACRLDFLPVTGDPQSAWIAAGKLVRSRMPAIPVDFYHDKYIYGIRCDEPRFPEPSATFEQCRQLIADVADLTDNAPQIVHLWGWQFRGKDTGYPAVNVVDERIGGYDGMMHLMEQGRGLNATVTLSDNYDDAYKSSPAWNEAMIARKPDGALWQSREWTGEVSFIQGLAKYMEGPGVERVRYTCERYKLPRTTHVDVLSYFAIRNDWDREKPASGIRNLRQGRYRVLEEFAKHGVDVTSEGLRYPMIGKISCCWYAQTSETSPLGGSPIPLLPLIYGKSAIWGLAGGMRGTPFELRARHLFWGANLHDILRASVDRKQIADVFYLIMVPWLHLHGREVYSFQREGDQVSIGLSVNNRIEIDWAQKNYRLSLDGAEAASEEAFYGPLDENRLCFYSLRAQQLAARWPDGWNQAEAAAVALSVGKREPVPFQVKTNRVSVSVAAQQPVILYRSRRLARL
ncbi:MAG TPA: endo-alpha-N-acetylgalactosaminidase family protein [Terracidiphilus sp.]|nr:endo-alpha-N-acetylgalactosaminidase family protein [Terracidiphilus sp.]